MLFRIRAAALFFINVTAGFITLLFGVISLISTTLICKTSKNSQKYAKKILANLGIYEYKSVEGELDKAIGDYIRLELLKEAEAKCTGL